MTGLKPSIVGSALVSIFIKSASIKATMSMLLVSSSKRIWVSLLINCLPIFQEHILKPSLFVPGNWADWILLEAEAAVTLYLWESDEILLPSSFLSSCSCPQAVKFVFFNCTFFYRAIKNTFKITFLRGSYYMATVWFVKLLEAEAVHMY